METDDAQNVGPLSLIKTESPVTDRHSPSSRMMDTKYISIVKRITTPPTGAMSTSEHFRLVVRRVPFTDEADELRAGAIRNSLRTSVASSVYRYRIENGRTYHAYKDGSQYIYFSPSEGPYTSPCRRLD
jgi:hypothetical protein